MLCLVVWWTGVVFAGDAGDRFGAAYEALITNADDLSPADRLHRLFDLQWRYELYEYPERATFNGEPEGNDRWTDLSREAIERRKRELRRPLKVLDTIDRTALSPADQLNEDLFRGQIEQRIEGTRFAEEYLVLDQMSGVHQ